VLFAAGMVIREYVASVHVETEQQRTATLVDRLINAAPADVPNAIEALRPLSNIAKPMLSAVLSEHPKGSSRELHAAFALAALGDTRCQFLTRQIASVSSSESRNLISALMNDQDDAATELMSCVGQEVSPERRTRYAITLLHLGNVSTAKETLAFASDPRQRTSFILGFKDWHGDLRLLADLLRTNDESAFRSGLCAALGLVDPSTLATPEREALESVLRHLYLTDPDGGTHSAADWALRHWNTELPTMKPSRRPDEGFRWFVNGLGMTMILVPPGRLVRQGGPDEVPKELRLSQSFLLSSCEVRVSDFQHFMVDRDCADENKPKEWRGPVKEISPTPDCPMQRVSWFDAVLFCNWLSKREGRTPCYRRTAEKQRIKVGEEMREFDMWNCDLAADGYRLPTEAEWEYACRAGTTTTFSFGDNPEWLTDHGWYYGNSKAHAWPVANKLPNRFGLFDMHGNVDEWCWDWHASQLTADPVGPVTGAEKVVRGGGWYAFEPVGCQSSHRYGKPPNTQNTLIGFRVVCRTQP
jgi:formylglycine-generating enzyme required for sulfatase activity